jgi:hypothetical protein
LISITSSSRSRRRQWSTRKWFLGRRPESKHEQLLCRCQRRKKR